MKKLIREFKEFISRGNVMDMAVGVIIGSAFTAIVNSLVGDVLTPILGLITGGMDFSDLKLVLGTGENAASLNYGAFLSAVINFLLIALVIFSITKVINTLQRKKGRGSGRSARGGACAPALPILQERNCSGCHALPILHFPAWRLTAF